MVDSETRLSGGDETRIFKMGLNQVKQVFWESWKEIEKLEID